jgi:predicted nucleic acid-binding protein
VDRTYIVDASPLILFDKVNGLGLMSSLSSHILVPYAVLQELSVGADGDKLARSVVDSEHFSVVNAIEVPHTIARWDLGAGESQVLATALGIPTAEVVIDDLGARKCAKSLGLPMVGTVGLVALLKHRGQIELARPLLTSLIDSGLRLSKALLDQVLVALGESK